ncbi:MAG: tetratricopeptide repeat protein [Candidatus Obscuribacterales bacterium]|nr:tetratricopeptide repeat protein [Candidatus Obscuribacterales bacterium]
MLRSKNHILIKAALLVSVTIVSLPQQLTATTGPSVGLIKQTEALLDEGRVDTALPLLDKLISNEPKNARAYSERSRAYRKTGRYDKALQDANKAVGLAPSLAIARVNRAPVYLSGKNYQKALKECNKAIALEPRLDRAYTMRASVYESLEKYQKVISDCDKAIAIAPKLPENYALRGNALNRLGQQQPAIVNFKKALTLSLEQPHPNRIMRGNIYLCLEEFKKAVEDCTEATKINPRSPDAYSLRARAYGELGQFQKEINDLTTAISIAPRDADLYEGRAFANYELGQLQMAIRDGKKAASLDARAWRANSYVATAAEELGLYAEAIKARNKLLLKGANAFEWASRAHIYELIGRHDLALADWRMANKLANPVDRLQIQENDPLIELSRLSADSYKKRIAKQLHGKAISLPFKYAPEGHFGVPVQVNGHALELMLDTGSGETQIWKMAMPGLAKMNTMQLHDNTATGKDLVYSAFRAQDLKLDNISLRNVQLTVRDGLVGYKTMRGFLGGNVLENFVVTIDYSKKEIILASSFKSGVIKNATVVPMFIRGHCPYCIVRIDDTLERLALLDTGAPCTTSADTLIESLLPKNIKYSERMHGPWLGELSCEGFRLHRVEVSNCIFKEPVFDVFPAFEGPRGAGVVSLGNDFLSQFKTVTFDYPGRRLIFEPNAGVSQSALNLYSQGRFSFRHQEDQRAIDSLSKSIALAPELAAHCYWYRAEAYLNLKKYQNAIQDFTEMIRLDPQNPWTYCQRAWAHGELRHYEKQIEDDTAAIRLDPEYRGAYNNRAWAYDRLYKHQLAEKDREVVKKLSLRR